jgi:hypothetical protein
MKSPAAEPPPEGGLPRGALLGLAALVAVSAVIAFVLLGGDDGDSEQAGSEASELAVPWIDPNGQDPIVGAVDVNPADDSITRLSWAADGGAGGIFAGTTSSATT